MNQWQRIVNHLKENAEITSLEAFEKYGVSRLSAVIFEIKAKGYKINTRTVEKLNRYGDVCRVAAYSLARG